MQPGQTSDDDLISLCVQFRGLSVTVQGRIAPALEFVREFTGEAPAASAPQASSHGPSSGTPSQEGYLRIPETRDSIARSFGPCPADLLKSGSRLSGSASLSGEERIKRAFVAGQWASATCSGRVSSPNRTPTLDLGNRFYCVLRAQGQDCERVFTSSKEYFSFVGDLQGPESVSHAFPSEAEAKAFFAGARRPYPSSQ